MYLMTRAVAKSVTGCSINLLHLSFSGRQIELLNFLTDIGRTVDRVEEFFCRNSLVRENVGPCYGSVDTGT